MGAETTIEATRGSIEDAVFGEASSSLRGCCLLQPKAKTAPKTMTEAERTTHELPQSDQRVNPLNAFEMASRRLEALRGIRAGDKA